MPVLDIIANHYFRKPAFQKFFKPVEPVEDSPGLYILADGSLGFIMEVEGINIEGRSVEQISDSISKIMGSLSTGYCYQLLLFSFKGCDEIKSVAESGETELDAVRKYMVRKLKWHKKGKKDAFAKEGMQIFAPRTIKTYLTVKEPGRHGARNEADLIKTIKRFYPTCQRIMTVFSTLTGVTPVPTDGLISLYYRFLNQKRSLTIEPIPYNGGDMRKSFIYSSVENSRKHGIISDEYRYKVTSFGQLPVTYDNEREEYFTVPNVLFEEKRNEISLVDIAESMLVAFNFEILDSSRVSAKLEAKRSMAKKHEVNVIGNTEAIDKAMIGEDTAKMLEELYKGNVPIQLGIHVVLPVHHDPDEEENDLKEQEVLTFLNSIVNANAFFEDLIADAMFLRSLPFGFDTKINPEAMVQRNIDCTIGNLADLSPLYRYGKKVISPLGCIVYSRRGELLTVDVFDKQTAITSPHMLVTGKTGSGKSVTMCDFINQFLRQPAKVIIIDKEVSYRTICQLAGGQRLTFEGIPDIKMDPFEGDWDDDHKSQLVNILALMQAGSEETSQDDRAIISQAVAHVARSGRPSMRELVSCLERNFGDERSKSIARRLYMYYGEGQYARFIEGNKPNLNIHSDITLFELADIDTYKDLQTVVIALLIQYITEYVKKVPGRKYLILDEVHTLLKNKVAVDYLVMSVKTFRKRGCAVIFVTQQLDDFKQIARALNMKKNCPNQILLYQDWQEILENAEDLGLTQDQLEAYKTVRKHSRFSEAFYKMENWSSIGRITLDPESYWSTTSSLEDRLYIKRVIKEKGVSLEDALAIAATQYPYGLPAELPASRAVVP